MNMMMVIITVLFTLTLLMLAKQVSSVTSFEFANLEQNTRGIYLERDASLSSAGLELTKNQVNVPLNGSFGRASYENPVQLWDPLTRRLAGFATHFTFAVSKLDKITDAQSGDGMAFFIAPFDSRVQSDSGGGSFGLFSPGAAAKGNSSANRFVAVEFDTFLNGWDPSSDHVGIDIDSVVSKTNMSWTDGTMKDGRVANAWVSYNSTSHNLSVYLTYDKKPVFSWDYYVLSYVVDLRDYLPERVRVGLSGATGLCNETHTVFSWSFNSTLDLIENTTSVAPSPSLEVTPAGTSVEKVNASAGKGTNGLAIGLAVGFGVVFSGLGFVWFVCWRKRGGSEIEEEEEYDASIDGEFEQGTGPKRYTYNELRRATGDFAEEGKLGEGGFGGVYKGLLPESGVEVAVKRISKTSKQGQKEYASEIKIISRLRHRNLVQLLGWCHRKGEFLLVYEYLPNGSLDFHLFGGEVTMPWTVRHKVALGLTSALFYLHEECQQYVVHRDIKSSNIMLDAYFNAKLGDFGLARFVDHEYSLHTVAFAGTMGYIAPEALETGNSSKETDVYSFGVVALEICCGRRSVVPNADEPNKVKLVGWVWELYGKGLLLEAVDKRLNAEFDVKEIECLMIVGLWCCHPHPNYRPSIKQAISVLSFEAPLPNNLPKEMPRPMYSVAPLSISLDSYSSSAFTASSVASSTSTSDNTSKPLLNLPV